METLLPKDSDIKCRKRIRKDLDDILVGEVGELGVYQLRVIVLAGVAAVFSSWSCNNYTFTAARIDSRCFIPGCDTNDSNTDFVPAWISHAVPVGEDVRSVASCQRYAPLMVTNADLAVANDSKACAAEAFDRATVLSCDHSVYRSTYSIVYDFDLACDEWRRSLVGSARSVGMMLGLLLSGYASDRFGRRTSLTITAFTAACVGLLRLLPTGYIGFTVLEFAESALGYSYNCAYMLAMELVGPKHRKLIAAAMNSFFSVGLAVMGVLAWQLQNWRHLTLTLYLPQLLSIFYIWTLAESVRWYMSNGFYDKSDAVLREVARVNGRTLSEKSLKLLRSTKDQEKEETPVIKINEWLICQVFKHKPILIRCIVAPVWWVAAVMIYYGLSLNAVGMSGNGYLNYTIVALVEIPGLWASVYLMDTTGRKPVLIVSFWICAVCQAAYILLPKEYWALSLGVYLIGKSSIASVMSTIYTYTAELFPTCHRQSLFSFCSMVGRLGSVVAPLTPALGLSIWAHLPFALFGALAFVSGLLVLVTPETRGSKFPDTMQDANNIGKKPNNVF